MSATPGFPSTAKLLWTQTVYQLRSFRRIPIAVFFTLGLPLIMLVLFNALFGSNPVDTPTGSWSTAQFYTGGLAAFTAVSATFTNLANMVPLRRDEGVLKRWRGTPLPTWVYLGGFICSAVVIAVAGAIAMLALGVVVYDLDVDGGEGPGRGGDVPHRRVGVRRPRHGARRRGEIRELGVGGGECDHPAAGVRVERVRGARRSRRGGSRSSATSFPLKPFVESFQACFNPTVASPAFDWAKMGYVALWGLAGVAVALKRFRWEPSGSAPRGRRTRRVATS